MHGKFLVVLNFFRHHNIYRPIGVQRNTELVAILKYKLGKLVATVSPLTHKTNEAVSLFVGWLLNVPATCECISGTDLHRQYYVLPH